MDKMNSNPNTNNNFDEEESAGESSDASGSSAAVSRAERLRRERAQRHRQRLHRAKQLHHSSHSLSSRSTPQPQPQPQPQTQTQTQPQPQRPQQPQPQHQSYVSSDSSASTAGSSSRRSQEPRGRRESRNVAPPPAAAPQQTSQQQPTRKHPAQKGDPQQQPSQQQHQVSRIAPPPGGNAGHAASNGGGGGSKPPHASSHSQSATQAPPSAPNHTAAPAHPQPPAPPQPPPPKGKPPPQHHAPPSGSSGRKTGPVLVSVESPLPPLVQRSLGDRSYEKRKNAALEIEQLVKSLGEARNVPMIQSVIAVLAKDFCTSMNANYRKGGLIGIAATAIGLMGNARGHLEGLISPVLHCFDDPESRVRYYACESLYNIAKVARGSVLRYFNQVFDGLTKLFADVDVDVKNGANLLDRLIKDIVTESEAFHVEHFLPLLTTYIRRTNPYIRQLLVGWITVLDSVPDISMIDYLPDFLDGLFNMLSDSNPEIRQAADSALSDFLREVRHATVIEFGPLVSILVAQCLSQDRLNRLTSITWIEELIQHPHSGGDALLPHHAVVLGAILHCISDTEEQICLVAERTNSDLLSLVRDTHSGFQLAPLIKTLTEKFLTKDDVPTKMAALRWINMLLEKRRRDMTEFVPQLLPVLLKTLSDASDAVVLFALQVLARISLGDGGGSLEEEGAANTAAAGNGDSTGGVAKDAGDDIHGGLLRGQKDEKHFKLVVNAILGLFVSDRRLLENRGSLVIRKFCVLLDAESVYMLLADVLSASCDVAPGPAGAAPGDEGGAGAAGGRALAEDADAEDDASAVTFSVEFVSTMVQTLNLILLTANELHGLRVLLANAFELNGRHYKDNVPSDERPGTRNSVHVFESIFRCWCHSPVATFSLCLLARAYGVAFALVQKFSELEVTVGFLMQIDKLVQLLESPVFVHLRLQLLDVESLHHAPLLKSCYGLLMLLPQSDAFRSLNDRLATVCNLRDNLGISPALSSAQKKSRPGLLSKRQVDLLSHFDAIMDLHRKIRSREAQQLMVGELLHDGVSRASRVTVGSSAVGSSGKGSNRVGTGVAGAGTGVPISGNVSQSVFYTDSGHHGGSNSSGTTNAPNGRGRVTQEV